jgi:ferredoxin
MRDFADFFSEPRAADISAAEGAKKKAREKTAAMSFDGLKEKLDRGFDSPLWESISRVCLGCGLCTYQCPTCHCFDITDEKDGQDGTRIRAWDSCQYALFTHHASGHNPRPEKVQRMRQRILHKFQFTVDNFDEVFCVGCGRCVQNCPVNLDVREALRTLVKALP